MHIRYDDDFLEKAVFLTASGKLPNIPSLQISRFHAERERCYDILDPDKRATAFFDLHLEWFRAWGLEHLLLGLVNDYPLLSPALTTLAFRNVRMQKDEGAELYVSPQNGRNAVVAMRSERFASSSAVADLLRHELMHLHDMVDPAFGYSPELNLARFNPTQQRITCERYRLLWDITIDGRLATTGGDTTKRKHHEIVFHRAFSFWPEDKRSRVFESYWNSQTVRHNNLLALAADPRDVSNQHIPLPGSLCPICHFPTFEWANLPMLLPNSLAKLCDEFPHWNPEHGACARCVEMYENLGKFELPGPVVLQP